jgi:hypothetical protein
MEYFCFESFMGLSAGKCLLAGRPSPNHYHDHAAGDNQAQRQGVRNDYKLMVAL